MSEIFHGPLHCNLIFFDFSACGKVNQQKMLLRKKLIGDEILIPSIKADQGQQISFTEDVQIAFSASV